MEGGREEDTIEGGREEELIEGGGERRDKQGKKNNNR
jgi:hypothetical protein